jgi:hypothetical protein
VRPRGSAAARTGTEAFAQPLASASRLGLQLHDPTAGGRGLGLIAGIAHLPDGDTGARLVLFPGGSRMAIFVGHERGHGPLAVDGLRIAASEDALEIDFDGHALLAEDGASYFRDEKVQAAARLVRASVALVQRARDGSGYGRAEGRVVLDGERFDVDGFGFTAPFLAPRASGVSRTRALAAFRDDLALVADTGGASVRLAPGGPESLGRAEIHDGVGRGGGGFSLDLGGAGRLDCHPENAVQVWRPLSRGRAARVTFGVARFRWSEGGEGSGFYERVSSEPASVRPE